MPNGVLANDILDDFPSTTRPGAGNHAKQTTDVDVALNEFKRQTEAGTATGVLRFLDYNVDEDGNSVDENTARQRANGRIAPLKKRGYTIENGWVLASRSGNLYAKYFGPGNVPDSFIRKERAVGEAVPV